ncbi:NUDIX domain-containing protein [Nocardia sp. NPDC020380]|uniref:NUDIX domain-containing protein n=1 Tax=Nocardia sp. NPDC020380 TaxID=3364309 RepID=UPI00378F8105
MQPTTAVIAATVAAITPWDELERLHIARTSAWLHSTDDIYRRIQPATPSPHLVAYTVLVDPDESGVYLGRHRKADLYLPMGGHVEPGEHPRHAARREAGEELGIPAVFDVVGEQPLFLTVTPVTRPAAHIDCSLWYVIRGMRTHAYALDPAEFDGGRWWDLNPETLPESDPHLHRFVRKLNSALASG